MLPCCCLFPEAGGLNPTTLFDFCREEEKSDLELFWNPRTVKDLQLALGKVRNPLESSEPFRSAMHAVWLGVVQLGE